MKKLFFTIVLITLAHIGYAQLPVPANLIQSPNVANLGIYGEVPVSPFTGVPQIDIPIYEFSVSGHKFPISINYHPSGIKPDQRAGWLGVGWTLMAGGCISRIENGMIDEYKVPGNPSGTKKNTGYLYNKDELSYPNWNTSDFLRQYLLFEDPDIFDNGYDNNPDEFRFNFLGYSGSIYLNYDGVWKVKSDRNIKIVNVLYGKVPIVLGNTSTTSLQTNIITGFILRGDNGVKYTFGVNSEAIELSKRFFDQNQGDWLSTSWHLTNISYPNGEKVDLTYERGDLTNQLWNAWRNYYTGASTGDKWNVASCAGSSFHTDKYMSMGGNLISPVFLKSIVFPFGSIEILSNNRALLENNTKSYSRKRGNTSFNMYFYYLVHGVAEGDKILKDRECYSRLQSRALESITIKDNKKDIFMGVKMKCAGGVLFGVDC